MAACYLGHYWRQRQNCESSGKPAHRVPPLRRLRSSRHHRCSQLAQNSLSRGARCEARETLGQVLEQVRYLRARGHALRTTALPNV